MSLSLTPCPSTRPPSLRARHARQLRLSANIIRVSAPSVLALKRSVLRRAAHLEHDLLSRFRASIFLGDPSETDLAELAESVQLLAHTGWKGVVREGLKTLADVVRDAVKAGGTVLDIWQRLTEKLMRVVEKVAIVARRRAEGGELVVETWQVVEEWFIGFVKWVTEDEKQSQRQVCLLESRGRGGGRGGMWQVADDGVAAVFKALRGVRTSVYHVRALYGTLKEVVERANRVVGEWTLDGGSRLVQVVAAIVEIFVDVVRTDVRDKVNAMLGKRAGGLLRPVGWGKEGGGKLPALKQVSIMTDLMQECLGICVDVGGVSRRIGEIINGEILGPFGERAVYALRLAESWSEAGSILNMMRCVVRGDAEYAETLDRVKPLRGKGGNSLKVLRKNLQVTIECLQVVHKQRSTDNDNTNEARMLEWSEWEAVVRLIRSAKLIIGEMERWGEECDNCTGMQEAMNRTRGGVRRLKEEVIERGVMFLHVELTSRCFLHIHSALTSGSSDAEDGRVTGTGGCASAIFKPASLQVEAVSGVGVDGGGGVEYDEFGDRIVLSEGGEDVDMEEYGLANWVLADDSVSNSGRKLKGREGRMTRLGKKIGEEMRRLEECVLDNLDERDTRSVFGKVDAATALAIRECNARGTRAGGDRELAWDARAVVEAVAGRVGERVGWGEGADYSVVEGSSETGGECRSLMYAAGMM